MSTDTSLQRERPLLGASSALFGSRWVLILAGLLALQLAVTAFVYWYNGNADAGSGGPLLADFDPAQVQSLTITDGNGRVLRVARADDGWVLPEGGDYPVRGEKANDLLEELAALQRDRLVGTQNTTFAQLDVAEEKFTRRLDLAMADGSQRTVYIGAGPTFRASHVRLGDENQAFLTLDFPSDNTAIRMQNWIDTAYVRLAETDIQELTLENGNGQFVFFRDESGQWQMQGLAEGEVFNDNNLISLLTSLTGLNMAEPLGTEAKPEYGLDDPTARVTFVYTDAEGNSRTAELRIGALDPTGAYYVLSYSESPYFVHISKFSVDRFVERTRDEFLVQPPTPTPEPTPVP